MRIREARARDALELVDLRRRVVAEGRWFISDPDELDVSVDDMIQTAALLAGSDRGTLLVARDGGRVVGFLSLRAPPFRRMAHVVKLEIAVDPSVRGRGIGRSLLLEGIGWAGRSSVVRKIGLSVFADNTRAIGLYRSLGFQQEGHRRAEYRMADGTFRDDLLLFLPVDDLAV